MHSCTIYKNITKDAADSSRFIEGKSYIQKNVYSDTGLVNPPKPFIDYLKELKMSFLY